MEIFLWLFSHESGDFFINLFCSVTASEVSFTLISTRNEHLLNSSRPFPPADIPWLVVLCIVSAAPAHGQQQPHTILHDFGELTNSVTLLFIISSSQVPLFLWWKI